MADPFLGEVRMIGTNFAPVGWALCDGSLLPISENDALFSLIGTTYGGDGISTFAVPDLRGRTPIHMGQGPGLSPRVQGDAIGREAVTLISANMPIHFHTVHALSTAGTQPAPDNAYWAADSTGEKQYAPAGNASMALAAISSVGGGQPHENMMPFQAVTFIIATAGIFPSR